MVDIHDTGPLLALLVRTRCADCDLPQRLSSVAGEVSQRGKEQLVVNAKTSCVVADFTGTRASSRLIDSRYQHATPGVHRLDVWHYASCTEGVQGSVATAAVRSSASEFREC